MREPDQERFELSPSSLFFQWVRNSNCCTRKMGQIVQRFEQKKSSENKDEKVGAKAARNKAIPVTWAFGEFGVCMCMSLAFACDMSIW